MLMEYSGPQVSAALLVALTLTLGACAAGPATTSAPLQEPSKAQAPASVQVLLLSDIHFNPFDDKALVPKLLTSPAPDWRSIFEGSTSPALGSFGRETSYPLWKSTLAAMAEAAPDPAAILISGDFLAHRFPQLFAHASSGQNQETFEGFVDKTVAFIAGELRRTFPRAQILPALGNNDSPCGNYKSQPRSPFLAHFASAFGSAVTPDGATAELVKEFSEGGYYSVAMRFNTRARVIVLNSNFWSAGYENRCGASGNRAPGEAEMAWLEKQLAGSSARGEHAWVLSHIPPGIDLFSTLQQNANPCHGKYVHMLEESFNQRFLGLLDRFHAGVSLNITGHTHHHEIHVLGASPERSIASLTVPAVSSGYKNNPSFVVAKVNPNRMVLEDFAVHALAHSVAGATSPSPTWSKEYEFGRLYGQRDLSGPSALKLLAQLHDDPALRQRYIDNFTSNSGVPNPVFQDWKLYECSMNSLDVVHLEKCYCPGK